MRAHRALVLASVLLLLGCPARDDDDATDDDDGPSAPGAMNIAITPSNPITTDFLSVDVVSPAEDPDGDVAGTRYSWRVDEVARADLDGMTSITPDRTQRGETWEVTAIPFDSTGLDGPAAVAAVTIANSPPSAPGIAITPAAPIAGEDDLLCLIEDASTDLDGDAITYTLEWDVDGDSYPGVGHIGPSTAVLDGDTVPAGDSGPGQVWTCRITPADAVENGSSATAQVTTSAPLPMPDFELRDVNETSSTFGQPVSPRDHLESVSGWYFGHAT